MKRAKRKVVLVFVTLLLVAGCTLKQENASRSQFLCVEKKCRNLLATPSFISFIDELVKETEEDEEIVFSINYYHFEYQEIPKEKALFIEQMFNNKLTTAVELPSESIQNAFQKFSAEHGDFIEAKYITISKEKEETWVCIDISFETAQLIDVHLINGNPLDALYHTSIFYNPGINNHWNMEFIQLTEEWYLVWFYLADET